MPNNIHEARKWTCGTAPWLSLWVYNLDMNPGLITKVLTILQIISLSVLYILCGSMCLSTCPLPLCIHGNSSPFGQLLAFEQCPVTFSADWDHWKAHTSMSVCLFLPKRVKMQFGLYPFLFLFWVENPKGKSANYWLLMVFLTRCNRYALLLIFLSVSLVWSQLLTKLSYGTSNHIDTSQLNSWRSELLLTRTAVHVVCLFLFLWV